MPNVEREQSFRDRARIWSSVFAVVAAVAYFIVAAGLAPGDPTAPPAGVMLLAGLAYLVGAGLIQLNRRWLLVTGAILNPLVIVAFFVSFLLGNAEIEVVSLVSKLAQVGLQVTLLMLLRRHASASVTVEAHEPTIEVGSSPRLGAHR
jgi:hypothetical protein